MRKLDSAAKEAPPSGVNIAIQKHDPHFLLMVKKLSQFLAEFYGQFLVIGIKLQKSNGLFKVNLKELGYYLLLLHSWN
jgi:hypothetical protein